MGGNWRCASVCKGGRCSIAHPRLYVCKGSGREVGVCVWYQFKNKKQRSQSRGGDGGRIFFNARRVVRKRSRVDVRALVSSAEGCANGDRCRLELQTAASKMSECRKASKSSRRPAESSGTMRRRAYRTEREMGRGRVELDPT